MTVYLLFAQKSRGVGAYKLNLYYFYSNALQSRKVVGHM